MQPTKSVLCFCCKNNPDSFDVTRLRLSFFFFSRNLNSWKWRFDFFLYLSLLYYNLCLCKSSQSSYPFGAQISVELSWGASLPVCGCKGTPTFDFWQAYTTLFSLFSETFLDSHYILYIQKLVFFPYRGGFMDLSGGSLLYRRKKGKTRMREGKRLWGERASV